MTRLLQHRYPFMTCGYSVDLKLRIWSSCFCTYFSICVYMLGTYITW